MDGNAGISWPAQQKPLEKNSCRPQGSSSVFDSHRFPEKQGLICNCNAHVLIIVKSHMIVIHKWSNTIKSLIVAERFNQAALLE